MRFLGIILALFISMPLMAQYDNIEVSTDYTAGTDLQEYESYFWVVDDKMGENTWISLNTLKAAMIRDAIEFKMDVEAYQKDPENPDILVNYHIFDQNYDVEGYVPTAPFEYRYMENKAKLENITDGTLVVSIYSPEKEKVVWEGYATNVIQEDSNLRENQKNIRYAVSNIMDRFQGVVLTGTDPDPESSY